MQELTKKELEQIVSAIAIARFAITHQPFPVGMSEGLRKSVQAYISKKDDELTELEFKVRLVMHNKKP